MLLHLLIVLHLLGLLHLLTLLHRSTQTASLLLESTRDQAVKSVTSKDPLILPDRTSASCKSSLLPPDSPSGSLLRRLPSFTQLPPEEPHDEARPILLIVA
ncbi:hypothetical protein F4778DRAFT_736406 [Xylariomycetidae sp. FL2044]|nr:hypothetical protein F4778DRAFT_736406 [Xylariomycetidae sp. FL2044]